MHCWQTLCWLMMRPGPRLCSALPCASYCRGQAACQSSRNGSRVDSSRCLHCQTQPSGVEYGRQELSRLLWAQSASDHPLSWWCVCFPQKSTSVSVDCLCAPACSPAFAMPLQHAAGSSMRMRSSCIDASCAVLGIILQGASRQSQSSLVGAVLL
jgi:hypothetical protein